MGEFLTLETGPRHRAMPSVQLYEKFGEWKCKGGRLTLNVNRADPSSLAFFQAHVLLVFKDGTISLVITAPK